MTLTTESALRKDKRNAAGDLGHTMQHRHFAVIAGILASIPDPVTRQSIALRFAEKLSNSNPRFDRARFLRACGVRS